MGSDSSEGAREGAVTAPAGLAFGSWIVDGDRRRTQAEIGPEGCIEGTDRPLTGVLLAYLDVVIGSPPSGAMNPTVDLQVRLFAAPRSGVVHFVARTLRVGRTLYVGEAEMRHDGEDQPFGVAVATFVNQPVPFPDRDDPSRHRSAPGTGARMSYGALRGARRVGQGVFELEADVHTPQGTVSGATLARLVELAARDLLGGVVVDELDLRFLNKVRSGALRATAAVLGRRDDTTTVRVEVVDAGQGDRLVTYALAVCRMAPGT